MIFTQNQIEELLRIIRYSHTFFIASNVGIDILTEQDKFLLKQYGVDLTFLNGNTPIDMAYKFGVLSMAIGHEKSKDLSYDQFKKFLRSREYVPLTIREQKSLEFLKKQSYNYVKSLSDKIESDVYEKIVQQENLYRLDEPLLKTELERAIRERKGVKSIVSELGNKTQRWEIDLGRIAETEMHNLFDQGRAMELKEREGEEAKVYKRVYPGACKSCVKLYLTAGIGSQPIIFKLSELEANGLNNVGRKQAEWKPVVGSVHPWCFSDDTEVLTNEGWKFFKEITLKEKFLSLDIETENAFWVSAINKIQYFYEGKMHHIKSRDFDCLTTINHRHLVKSSCWKKKPNKLKLVEGNKLPTNSRFLRSIPNWIGIENKTIKISNIKFNEDDWFKFMGWYLSEGSISYHKNERFEIKITQSDKKLENKKEIYEVCKKLFHRAWFAKEYISIPINTAIGFYDEKFVNHFLEMGRSYEKFIPDYIKNGSKRLLKIFLLSFCKGDGTFNKPSNFKDYEFNGDKIYYTSSNKMASDIGEILLKIGKRPSYYYDKGGFYEGYKTRPVWNIVECNNQYAIRTSRKQEDRLKEVDYSGMVYDVELEKYHTLFVRRNGKVWCSGNCRCTLNEYPDNYVWDEEKQSFVPPKDYEGKVQRRAKIKITVDGKTREI